MEIRELDVGQADRVVELFEAVLPDSPAVDVEQPAAADGFLGDSHSFFLGAYVDERPIGLAWGVQMRSPSGRLTSYLHELDVHQDWRRHGVGSALVSGAMSLARRRGSTRFWLSTGGHNEAAQALYESLGGDRKPLGDVNYWWELG